MKKITFLAFLLILLLGIKAQTTEEDQVKQIREWFANTNNNKVKYDTKSFDMPDQATEGATLTAFYDGNQIVLLEAEYYGESGNFKSYHYFWNGMLFFVFTVREVYSSHIMDPNNKVASKEENRYYFWEGKMIRWLDPQKNKVSKTSKIFQTEEKSIIDETDQLYLRTQELTHD